MLCEKGIVMRCATFEAALMITHRDNAVARFTRAVYNFNAASKAVAI
jgi:hypothetical protein